MPEIKARGWNPSYARRRLGDLAGDGAGWHEVTGWPVPVVVRLAKGADGRLVCTSVVLDGHPDIEITSRMIRSIPLGEAITEAAGTAAGYGELARWMADHGAAEGPTRVRPGPHGYPPEHFEAVAALYRKALEVAPLAPMRWMKSELNMSEPTVRRWVQKARDRGLLGPSMPGKAGEAPINEETS